MPSAKNKRARSNAGWAKTRAELLRDNPVCHWCKKRKATEADHIIEVDRGGSNDPENLVPSCKQCNARRGANYKAAKQRRAQAARPGATKQKPKSQRKPKRFLDEHQSKPPRPSSFSRGTKRLERKGKGHDRPRIETIVSNAVGSHGPNVAAWSQRVLGVELMPWQRHVLDGQLAYDADGKWCNPMSLVSVARQNGKTVALKALLGWWLTDYQLEAGPQNILTTAHRLDLATSLFQDLAPILEEKFGAKVVWQYSNNRCEIGQSKWWVKAARPSAGHGMSIDLIIADEVFGIDSETLDIGLLPTQRARANPLCSMWSTAGTEDSIAMLRWREQGIRAIDERKATGIYLAEYSPPPDLDPMSAAAWEYANPALGHTLDIRTIEQEAKGPNRAGFLRSSVNLWVQSELSWLQPGRWESLHTESRPVPGGVLACEVSIDDGRYVAVRVNANTAGILTATVAFMCETVTQVWDNVRQQLRDNPGLTLAITPTLDTNCPTDLQRRRIIVGYQEIGRFTQLVRQLINEGRVNHTGETMLAEHIGRAVAVKTPSGLALSSTKSSGPIELARCLVWAVGMMSRPRPMVNRPQIASSA
jgi:5-methylcytosine-specific restriction protein A